MTCARRQNRRRPMALVAALVLAGALTSFVPAAASAATCQAWTGVQPPSPGTGSTFNAVAVLSACDAWAVGSDSTSSADQTLIEHWDGAAWSVITSPSPGGTDDELQGVRAASPNSIWAVGFTTSGGRRKTLIEHWDGAAWSVVTNAPTEDGQLFGVRAVSPNDAWAVGFTGSQSLILHWNGRAWSRVPSPDPGGGAASNELFSVAAIARGDAWAVGDTLRGTGAGLTSTTLILHWNGTAWKQVPSPAPRPGSGLSGVGVTLGGNAWAVGFVGKLEQTSQTLTLHWDGHRWSRVASPNPGGAGNVDFLSGVFIISAGNAWAVGSSFTKGGSRSLVLHWNGTGWTHVPVPVVGTQDQLNGVAASSAGNVWTVGSSTGAAAPFHALALHCC